jgi:hypothetical protein
MRGRSSELREGEEVLLSRTAERLLGRDPSKRLSATERFSSEYLFSMGRVQVTNERLMYRPWFGPFLWPWVPQDVGKLSIELSSVVRLEVERHWPWPLILWFEVDGGDWVRLRFTEFLALRRWRRAIDTLATTYPVFRNVSI